jgi:signal transduction histidine kinase
MTAPDRAAPDRATPDRAASDRATSAQALAVLAEIGTVLAAGVPAADAGPAELGAFDRGLAAAVDRALALLGTLPGVASVRLAPTDTDGATGTAGTLLLPLRAPGGLLAVDGDPEPVVRVVLGAAADQIGGVLRAGRHVRDVVDAAQEATRRARSDQRRLAGLIANLTQGVLVEDDERRVVLVNRAFTDLFDTGQEPAEMVGSSLDDLLGAAAATFVDPEEFIRLVRARMADRVPVLADELITLGGQVLERDFVPIGGDGADVGHLWIFRDVTKRKREEERLAEEYQRLIGITTAKNRFVASVSHELRTPLTSIVSFAGLLADPESGPLTAEQRDFLEIIERNGSRLIRLVGDLLMLSRLESGAVSLEMDDVDPAEVVTAAARGQQLLAADRGVDLQTRTVPGEPVVGDADRLGQVVDNLLSNAIKFTPPGGRVSATAVPDPDGWTVEISDTGIGIPAGEQDQLFGEFFRASNSRTEQTPGTGLGLAISRLIVDRHGGDLRLMSEQGRGTTAVLRLPAAGRPRIGW